MPYDKKKPARKVDAESGFNRTKSSRKDKAPPPPESESESVHSDSELESELDIRVKDDSRRRPKAAKKTTHQPSRDQRRAFIKGEEDDGSDAELSAKKSSDSKVAPHMAIMLAATYHLALGSISQPSLSSYIPSAGNMFMMLFEMLALVSENSLLHEMYPSFCSISVLLYYSHVYYYQILRARKAVGSGVLTRLEKRVLTLYEQVGPPESWPIAAPMIGFIQALGAHKPENPMFGWVVPAFPDFTTNHYGTPTEYGLAGLRNLSGCTRVPIVPAYQEFLRLFGSSNTRFVDGVMHPHTAAFDATHSFIGLEAETATSYSYQTLAFNEAWSAPLETESINGQISTSTARAHIRRWKVPAVPSDSQLTSLQAWCGFTDANTYDWMSHLLTTSSMMNRFFPGSTTLGSISPMTTLGSLTKVTYSTATARTAAANKLYHDRGNWTITAYGYSNTEAGMIDAKIGICASPRAIYTDNTIPAAARRYDAHHTGPFFVDTLVDDRERMETFITEANSGTDPSRRFPELISAYYDESAGRKKN